MPDDREEQGLILSPEEIKSLINRQLCDILSTPTKWRLYSYSRLIGSYTWEPSRKENIAIRIRVLKEVLGCTEDVLQELVIDYTDTICDILGLCDLLGHWEKWGQGQTLGEILWSIYNHLFTKFDNDKKSRSIDNQHQKDNQPQETRDNKNGDKSSDVKESPPLFWVGPDIHDVVHACLAYIAYTIHHKFYKNTFYKLPDRDTHYHETLRKTRHALICTVDKLSIKLLKSPEKGVLNVYYSTPNSNGKISHVTLITTISSQKRSRIYIHTGDTSKYSTAAKILVIYNPHGANTAEKKRILVIKENSENIYKLPGGKCFPSERTSEECLDRELRTELGKTARKAIIGEHGIKKAIIDGTIHKLKEPKDNSYRPQNDEGIIISTNTFNYDRKVRTVIYIREIKRENTKEFIEKEIRKSMRSKRHKAEIKWVVVEEILNGKLRPTEEVLPHIVRKYVQWSRGRQKTQRHSEQPPLPLDSI